MKEKYFEVNNKSSSFRSGYLSSLNVFLDEEDKKSIREREEYITPEKMDRDRERYRREFVEFLGFPLNLKTETAKPIKKILVAEEDGLKIYRLVFEILNVIEFYGILFEQQSENAPFVFALHGGGGTPETVSDIYDSENYNSFARRIIDKGATVFCPQLLLWHKEDFGGEEFDRKIIDGKLKQLGGSITALELYEMISTLNYFQENGFVKGKVGVAGMSYGGMYAMFLASVDTRFNSVLSSSFFNDRFKYSWSDWSYGGIAKKFTDVEVCALICPRALCISLGDKDEMFDISSGEKLFNKLQEYYAFKENRENLYCYSFDGKHEFDKKDSGIDFFISRLE